MQNNKEVVARFFYKLWIERDVSAIEEYLSEEAEIHSPMKTLRGRSVMREVVEKWLQAFPDLAIRSHEIIAEGEKVALRYGAVATHLGGFFDTKPTYREIAFAGVIICHLENGKIVDYWSLVDIHAILSQLQEYETLSEALES